MYLALSILLVLVTILTKPSNGVASSTTAKRSENPLQFQDIIPPSFEDGLATSDKGALCLILGYETGPCQTKLALIKSGYKPDEEQKEVDKDSLAARIKHLPAKCADPLCSMKLLAEYLKEDKSAEDKLDKRHRRPGETAAFYSGW